jgi:hypothetical protein
MKIHINLLPLTLVSFGIVLFQLFVIIYIIFTGNAEFYFILLVNTLAIISIYFVFILTNKLLTPLGKLCWALGILIFHVFTVPLYWYNFIRNNKQFENSFWMVKK